MMRSLYAAVSGLKGNQTYMDVIGNNIANVNTTGFKASNVTFQDMLSQTLQGASSPSGTQGGTNPMQVGLGVGVGSISTNFTDGSTQSTGISTNLAISGDGFFVVGTPTNQMYTRSGDFTTDQQGNFVNSAGYSVLGWPADASGVVDTTQPISALQIPVGSTMPAKVSTTITLAGNLNASATALDPAAVAADAAVVATDATTAVTEATNAVTAANTLKAEADAAVAAASAGAPLTAALAAQAAANDALTAANDALTAANDALTAANAAKTAADALVAGTGTAAEALTAANASATAATTAKTKAAAVVTAATAAAAAATASAAVTGADGTTTGNVVTAAGNFSAVAGTAVTAATTLSDATSTAVTSATAAANNDSAQPISYDLYDTQGNKYTLTGSITKTGVNTWTFTPSSTIIGGTDGKTVVANVSGGSSTIKFNADGTFDTSTVFNALTIDPTGGPYEGAGAFTVQPSGSTMTQNGSDSTAKISNTDGYAAGTLNGKTISSTGEIIGSFTNGRTQAIGRVALAVFNNPDGLLSAGGNLYTKTTNSGEAQIGSAGTGGRGTFTPGSLEMSNVDLAQQFTNMIVAQRAFQANSKIITTDDNMLEELVNLKR
ncbi:flagellar hook protein FlgE [Pelosinus fermentans]|uniref:Flagellar hook protein FlgE n=3 Tax=Pelosinus TaxID=365348 RepID=I9AZ80_9FIRM|nr:flagellar hook protein FlgE [Pelosinus fermentans]EIW18207.1 flagellar hook-basal body protein [Pelosinus fermentans B4]EIW24011.1 flagellar hook-basal body protein [Pelosinus fermentans A11]OAM94061.1 flagellar hook-basal body protein [Pelosinus fermentans DSM 17108]SDQ98665.1 flagellar hook protein FlgE [Pelosinus fermentans]